jgi:hypothetical protein
VVSGLLDRQNTTADDFASSAVEFVEARIPAVDVVSVMLNQRAHKNGDPYDVMDVGFKIPPYQDIYYCHPDAAKNWPRLALHEITLKADKVLSIYAGYQVREDVIPLIDPLPSDYPDGVLPGTPPPPLPVL